MRITDQYFWNLVFSLVFLLFIFMGTVILEGEAYRTYDSLRPLDLVLITLASFRVIRLVVYDKITAFFREQFYDTIPGKGGFVFVEPEKGPRRTIADLLSCPWCIGIWAAATVAFFYLLTPYALFPVLMLAIAAVASMLQLLSNLIGWKAEQLKQDVEGLE